ncbi:MAG: DUF349 domain-containing protein [Anaerorhabdus sp.]
MNRINDEFLEIDDLELDIEKRKKLIEQAKAINFEAADQQILKEISELRRQWRRISSMDSAYEQSLEEEFEGSLDVFFAKRREEYKENAKAKEELIAQAKQAANSTDWSKTTTLMSELMEQWKMVKTAGHEEDDRLWEQFNGERQKFFQRKEDNWKKLQDQFANAKKVKEALIEDAKKLVSSDDWNATSKVFQEMMAQWKKVGSAGREHEDKLWKEFNEVRQQFYERREEYNQHMKSVESENASKKKGMIKQAQEILERAEYSKEDTAAMKDLGSQWKEIGFAGKDNENKVWTNFRALMDQYFDNLKENRDQRHQEWRNRMLETRLRKQEMIASQKNQLKRMQENMVGMISERAVNELKEDMEDKKEFISQLEAELDDIDKKLAE